MKPIVNYGLSDSLIDAVRKSVEEAKLHPNQQKLDVHKPEKDELTSHDFRELRAGKHAGKKVKDGIDTHPKSMDEDEQIDEAMYDKAHAQRIVDRLKSGGDGNYSVGPENNGKHPVIHAYHPNSRVNRDIKMKKAEDEQMDEANYNSDNPEYEAQLAAIDMYHYKKADHHRRTLQTLGTQGKLKTPEGNFHKAALEKHQSALNAMAAFDHESMRSNLKREEYEQMDEVKLADLPRRFVPGRPGQYDGANYVDPQGADETAADMKKAERKRKKGSQGPMKRRFDTKSYKRIKDGPRAGNLDQQAK